MQGNPNGAELLQRRTSLPDTRWQYYGQSDRSLLADIDTGLLFLMAFWSGPSMQSFSRLTEALQVFEEDEVSLTVVDVDGAEDLCRIDGLREVACLYGTGELVLVRQGQVERIIRGGNVTPKDYETHIRKFLA